MTSESEKRSRIPVYVATALLWLASVGLGLWSLYYFYALAIRIYDVTGGREIWVGSLIGQAAVIIGALIWLGAVIATGEFHLKHAGERKSWKIIAYVLGVELVIIVVGLLAT